MKLFKIIAIIFVLALLFCVNNSFAQDIYDIYGEVLSKYVDSSGMVDYSGLKKDRLKLDIFTGMIARVDIKTYSDVEKKAFWINAYNALTLQTIIDHYPVKSIKDIKKVWDTKKNVAQGQYTLNEIEHDIVRPMGDPRIHFALNCASVGCPKLPKEPFLPKTLDIQLDRETRKFVNDKEKVLLDKKRKVLNVSSIFKWFKQDFINVSPDLKSYVIKYINEDQNIFLENNKVNVRFLKYDWRLNIQGNK